MEQNITLGKASAIRILVANELGLNPEFVSFAEMYMDGKLYVTQFGRLEKAGNEANELINKAGLQNRAIELSKRFL